MHEGDTHGKLGILRPCKRPLDPEELWRQDHYRQTWSAIDKRDEISNSPDKSRERVQGPHPLPPKVWQSGWRGCDTTEDREEYEQEGIAMMTISAMGPEMFEIILLTKELQWEWWVKEQLRPDQESQHRLQWPKSSRRNNQLERKRKGSRHRNRAEGRKIQHIQASRLCALWARWGLKKALV